MSKAGNIEVGIARSREDYVGGIRDRLMSSHGKAP